MAYERITQIRELNQMTQADLSKKLGITKSSVNEWEMGVSIPSTQELIALASLFKVSADYILGQEDNARANIGHLEDDEKKIVFALLRTFEKRGK